MLPLTTTRLLLRRFEVRDLAAFTQYRNKPEVARYQSWTSYSIDDATLFFNQQKGLAFDTDGTWFQIAVVRQMDEQMLGDVAVHFFDRGQQAEIGFTIDLQYQGQGYAFEATSAVVDRLFSLMKKHRLVATVDVRNHRAQKLLQAIGFRQEGHYRKNILFKGSWADEYAYALLHSEWK